MKEKISCSLDGELLEAVDALRKEFPVIDSRSCLIELACLCFLEYFDGCRHFDEDRRIIGEPSAKASSFIYYWIEKRCSLDAQKESKNRNV